MPGIPKTKRCTRCRKRKIKCDEDWPTCASCKRANVACSGPPAALGGSKFVPYSTSQAAPSGASSREGSVQLLPAGREGTASLRTIKSNILPDGSSVSSFRFASTWPRPYPTTVSDRVASRIVSHLEKSSTGVRQYLLSNANYLALLPAHLSHCAALRDCVALFASAWANFQRGLPCSDVTDPKLYSQALKSLQRGLRRGPPFSSEMLAAISVLERFEIMFDAGRPLFWSLHRDGMAAILSSRGPPNLEDELSVWLALDNRAVLSAHWLVRGGHNFYQEQQWKVFLEDAIATFIKGSTMKQNLYRMEQYLGLWSSMVREMQRIDQLPETYHLRRDEALHLLRRAEVLAAEVAQVGRSMFSDTQVQGIIMQRPDSETPVGAKYDFVDFDSLACFSTHASLSIVLNRIAWGLHLLLGEEPPSSLADEHHRFCRDIWMCFPYLRSVSLMAAIQFSDPIYLSYEGASGDIKEYLISWVLEIAQFRKRLSQDRAVLDKHLLETSLAMTGRDKHRERPDFPYWKRRSSST